MRNWIKIIGIGMVLANLVGCKHVGKSEGIQVDLGESRYYSEEELALAAQVVVDSFQIPKTTLISVTYDESNSLGWLEESALALMPERSVILSSSFKVSSENPVLTPYMVYESYLWILTQNEANDWEVVEWGF